MTDREIKRGELRELLERAVAGDPGDAGISVREARLLIMYYADALTLTEIAEVCDAKVLSIVPQIRQAMGKIRKFLNQPQR